MLNVKKTKYLFVGSFSKNSFKKELDVSFYLKISKMYIIKNINQVNLYISV